MKYSIIKLIVSLICIFNFSQLKADPAIKGKIYLDSTWNPVAYLSYIPSMDKLFTMTNDLIIGHAEIDSLGQFYFNTNFLPGEDKLYRIHITKKGYPPASLIIGGKEENHFFIIANNKSEIFIEDKTNEVLLTDVSVSGYYPNQMLQQINEMTGFIDTANFKGFAVKKEFIRKALSEKLRFFADTCSHPLVSLYALTKSNFESDVRKSFILQKLY